jgi:hypothetical protein
MGDPDFSGRSWELVEHYHPGEDPMARFASGSDFGHIAGLQARKAPPGGPLEPIRTEIRWRDPVSKLEFVTEIGHDPGAAEPFWIRYRDKHGSWQVGGSSTIRGSRVRSTRVSCPSVCGSQPHPSNGRCGLKRGDERTGFGISRARSPPARRSDRVPATSSRSTSRCSGRDDLYDRFLEMEEGRGTLARSGSGGDGCRPRARSRHRRLTARRDGRGPAGRRIDRKPDAATTYPKDHPRETLAAALGGGRKARRADGEAIIVGFHEARWTGGSARRNAAGILERASASTTPTMACGCLESPVSRQASAHWRSRDTPTSTPRVLRHPAQVLRAARANGDVRGGLSGRGMSSGRRIPARQDAEKPSQKDAP